MRKFLLSLMLLAFIGCEKDEVEDTTEYYVKYDVSCQYKVYYGSYKGCSIKVSGTGVRGTEVKDKYRSFTWSDTAGPFKKGDKVSLAVNTEAPTGAVFNTDATLSVSKSSSPFVAKRWATTQSDVNLSYVIK